MVGGKVLILGGIRSGKSGFAESLLAEAGRVRYVATAAVAEGDAAFAERIQTHRFRRPAAWETVEATGDPAELIDAITGSADPVLVDDLGNWASRLLGRDDARDLVAHLTEAVAGHPGQVVLVSPEVGLSVVPPTSDGVAFADLMGQLNQSIGKACDGVALVIAGQPTWLKQARPRVQEAARPAATAGVVPVAAATAQAGATGATPARSDAAATAQAGTAGAPFVARPAVTDPAGSPQDVFHEQTRALPIVETGMKFAAGMDLPIHDEDSRTGARAQLSKLDIRGAGLGELAKPVVFAAGTQHTPTPIAWQQPHMLLFHGVHEGDIAAGDSAGFAAHLAAEARRGEGAIGLLAGWNGVSLKVVDARPANDIAYGRAMAPELVDELLTEGWRMADEAVDSGADLIILGSCGPGAAGVAATVVARVTGGEVATLLARIVGPDGTIDDTSWMLRCAAARDALHRVRQFDVMAKTLLSELAGPDITLAAGVILGATARRTAVLMDGPMAAAAALLARDLGSQSRLWCTMPDHSGHPTTKAAADVLGLTPILDLKTDLGEGALSLLALPLLRAALHLSTSLPRRPELDTRAEPALGTGALAYEAADELADAVSESTSDAVGPQHADGSEFADADATDR